LKAKAATIIGTISSRNSTTVAIEVGQTFSKKNGKDMKKEIERIETLQYRLFILIIIFSIAGVTYLIRKWQPVSP
jgi:hypothetical protein